MNNGKNLSDVPYLDVLRPDVGWRTEAALLCSYSCDLVALVAAMLALAGLDNDSGSGSRVDFASTVEKIHNRFRVVVQRGRIIAPANPVKIHAILDQFIREAETDENTESWHPKGALVKHVCEETGKSTWRLWIGSRNLTRDMSWDIGLTLAGSSEGPGEMVPGIAEIGYNLARLGSLPGLDPESVRDELREIRWEGPAGCMLSNIEMWLPGTLRPLPEEPDSLKKLWVISPFLDGTVVGQFGAWGSERTERILLSSRPELVKLAKQAGDPLKGFQTLLFLEAPLEEDMALEGEVERDGTNDPDYVADQRSLHAKMICTESENKRLVWAGSANTTRRGLTGPNAEIVATMEVRPQVLTGILDFLRGARVTTLKELVDSEDDGNEEDRLEEARKKISSSLNLRLEISETGILARIDQDLSAIDPEIRVEVGLVGSGLHFWPKDSREVRLPECLKADLTELVVWRLTVGDQSISWVQRAILDPPLDLERDQHALARYLNPREFLQWLRSILNEEQHSGGSGNWDSGEEVREAKTGDIDSPEWWSPTLEEILRAWTRDPEKLKAVDRKLNSYLKMSALTREEELPAGEWNQLKEFRETWGIVRGQLLPGGA